MKDQHTNVDINTSSYLIYLLVVGVITYYISEFLLELYINGDQKSYRAFYQVAYGADFGEVLDLQKIFLGASEPLYAAMIWLGANYEFEKVTYMSFFNALMIVLMVRLLLLKEANIIVIILLCTNFYVIVLMTGAERLKFSYIFALIALNLSHSKSGFSDKLKYGMIACVVLSHLQSIIMLAAFAIGQTDKFYQIIKKYISFNRILLILVVSIPTVLYMINHQSEAISYKFSAYASRVLEHGNEAKEVVDLIKSILITFIVVIIASNKKRILLMGGFLACFIFVLGGERLNMILVSIMIYSLLEEKKINNPLIILSLSYFSYKSIDFVDNILNYGVGWIDQ